jgi:hypothetical protein
MHIEFLTQASEKRTAHIGDMYLSKSRVPDLDRVGAEPIMARVGVLDHQANPHETYKIQMSFGGRHPRAFSQLLERKLHPCLVKDVDELKPNFNGLDGSLLRPLSLTTA